uniref:Uncharacterized protein n=1 Tax=Lactuca sativa TaxID=4236 RepID=A0A9R1W2U7_LACSA|nr:hypothetical protein LSAT_V11C300141770 [Lactuca sativa]
MSRLQPKPVCAVTFTTSCSGDYVHMLMGMECHPLLFDHIMCKEFTTLPLRLVVRGLFPPSSSFSQFRQCVFPFVSPLHLVRLVVLVQVLNDLLHHLDDVDDWNVSMVYILE